VSKIHAASAEPGRIMRWERPRPGTTAGARPDVDGPLRGVPGSRYGPGGLLDRRGQRRLTTTFLEVTLAFLRPDFLAVTLTESFLPASLAVTL